MYLTMPRSLYRNFRSSIPQQYLCDDSAPSLGCVVVTDEESEDLDTFCWGLCKSTSISSLPFPQDRILKIVHRLQFQESSSKTKAWFVPVLEKPLSSNRYYIIKASGKYKGRAYTCSQFDGGPTCCFNDARKLGLDRKPKHFDYRDVYQQFEIHRYQYGGFFALPVAFDGVPPKFLRTKGWEVFTTKSFAPRLTDARGLIISSPLLDIPKLDFPQYTKRSDPVVIGRWYCPFTFVKEETSAKDQMQKSLFYEVTLKQWWEEIYSCENEGNRLGNVVVVNAIVKRRVVLISGMEAVKEARRDGYVYFKVKEAYEKRLRVGLTSPIFERLRCLQERRGWFDRREIDVKVEGKNEIRSENGWKRFACYVLVESFVFRRMDATLLMNFNFKNTDRIECRCE